MKKSRKAVKSKGIWDGVKFAVVIVKNGHVVDITTPRMLTPKLTPKYQKRVARFAAISYHANQLAADGGAGWEALGKES